MLRKFFLYIAISWPLSYVSAQLPKTDVYMAEFKNLNTAPILTSIKFLNKFNPNGYNNQPKFIAYDDLFLTVAKDTAQTTEIVRLGIKTNEYYSFTATEGISEFSATLMPQNGKVSCVRIEADGKDQSLWSYPADRSGIGNRLLPDLKNVGYYTWISKDSIALFLVGSPNTLVLANVKSGKTDFIEDNIGRCMRYDTDGTLYFVHKSRPDLWELKTYKISTKEISTLCHMPLGREDFDVLINGNIICGDGSKLKMMPSGKSKEWVEFADFSKYGINNINRISVIRDRLVFVNNK
jgi:hypothetical protein